MIKFLLKVVVTLVPAWLVWRNIWSTPGIDGQDFWNLMESIHSGYLVLAVLALLFSYLLGAAQWRLLLVRQGVSMSYREVTRLNFVGLFFNNFMPGNVGGDLKKIVDVRSESGQSLGAGLSATIFDRLFGLFFLNALALAVGLLFFIRDPSKSPFLLPSLFVFLGFCLLFAAMFSRRIGLFAERVMAVLLPKRFVERFAGLRDRFHLFRSGQVWLQIFVLSILIQVLRVLVHWLCGLAIGVDIAVSWYFYFIPIVAVVSAIPISIGGFGPREWLAQSLFARVGVGALESVVVQLLAYLVSFVVSMVGGVAFLFHHQKQKDYSHP